MYPEDDEYECVDSDGLAYPEHDYQPGEYECRRCGAEVSD